MVVGFFFNSTRRTFKAGLIQVWTLVLQFVHGRKFSGKAFDTKSFRDTFCEGGTVVRSNIRKTLDSGGPVNELMTSESIEFGLSV